METGSKKTQPKKPRSTPFNMRTVRMKLLAARKPEPDRQPASKAGTKDEWDIFSNEASLDAPCNALLGHVREIEARLSNEQGVPMTVIAEPGKMSQTLREINNSDLGRELD